MVNRMTPGSVIVDIAAERGGNCELTRPGRNHRHRRRQILGPINLPSTGAVSRQPDVRQKHRGFPEA